MAGFCKFIKAVIVLWTVAALNISAQDFSSRWLFGSAYNSKMKATWETEHYLMATVSGQGIMKAETADGGDLADYRVMNGRAAAGPFNTGDCFLFEIPAEGAQAGSFVSFDATLSANPGAPMHWVVEWKDGGRWVPGRQYVCHGPALGKDHKYTTIHQTYRLKKDPEDALVSVRLRALDGAVIPPYRRC